MDGVAVPWAAVCAQLIPNSTIDAKQGNFLVRRQKQKGILKTDSLLESFLNEKKRLDVTARTQIMK